MTKLELEAAIWRALPPLPPGTSMPALKAILAAADEYAGYPMPPLPRMHITAPAGVAHPTDTPANQAARREVLLTATARKRRQP